MSRKQETDINSIILEAHRKGVEAAIDLSFRTGTSLIIEKDGKIQEIKPKFKYVLVPIHESKSTKHTKSKSH